NPTCQPSAENRRSRTALQVWFVATEGQFVNTSGYEPVTGIEVARSVPGGAIIRVLLPARSTVGRLFRRLIRRFRKRVGIAVAVTAIERALDGDVDAVVSGGAFVLAVFEIAKRRVRTRTTAIQRLIQISEQRNIPPQRRRVVGRHRKGRTELPFHAAAQLV